LLTVLFVVVGVFVVIGVAALAGGGDDGDGKTESCSTRGLAKQVELRCW
tara:strand:- start:14 stop:160 length:147 start_codon:yes stop_codon:yes gene_type:complete